MAAEVGQVPFAGAVYGTSRFVAVAAVVAAVAAAD